MCDPCSVPVSKDVSLFLGTGGYITGHKPELSCARCKLNGGDHKFFGDFEDPKALEALSKHLNKHVEAGHDIDIKLTLKDIVRWHWYIANHNEYIKDMQKVIKTYKSKKKREIGNV